MYEIKSNLHWSARILLILLESDYYVTDTAALYWHALPCIHQYYKCIFAFFGLFFCYVIFWISNRIQKVGRFL